MLPEDPCIPYLIGCGSGNRVVTAPWAVTTAVAPPWAVTTAVAARPVATQTAFSPGQNRWFAIYTVTIRNLASQSLPGLTINHGPVPFGATFSDAYSEAGCDVVDTIVSCPVMIISPQESKTVTIVYRIQNPAHCRLAPLLQSVQAVIAGQPAGSVVTSVSCDVRSTTPIAQSTSSTFGAKPYPVISLPRVGAATEYFSATGKPDFVIVSHRTTSQGSIFPPVLWLSLIGVVCIGLLLKAGFVQKMGRNRLW